MNSKHPQKREHEFDSGQSFSIHDAISDLKQTKTSCFPFLSALFLYVCMCMRVCVCAQDIIHGIELWRSLQRRMRRSNCLLV